MFPLHVNFDKHFVVFLHRVVWRPQLGLGDNGALEQRDSCDVLCCALIDSPGDAGTGFPLAMGM